MKGGKIIKKPLEQQALVESGWIFLGNNEVMHKVTGASGV